MHQDDMDDRPYKIVWKKTYNIGDRWKTPTVHYEQYMELENAETRMDELLRLHKVDATIYYPDQCLRRKY